MIKPEQYKPVFWFAVLVNWVLWFTLFLPLFLPAWIRLEDSKPVASQYKNGVQAVQWSETAMLIEFGALSLLSLTGLLFLYWVAFRESSRAVKLVTLVVALLSANPFMTRNGVFTLMHALGMRF